MSDKLSPGNSSAPGGPWAHVRTTPSNPRPTRRRSNADPTLNRVTPLLSFISVVSEIEVEKIHFLVTAVVLASD
ncbi:hypothetical protein BGS_1082 [Beggiatoa sp. SS]|nr:hypothetical protein BGS_1082 [Beggiatoa sp. SS]